MIRRIVDHDQMRESVRILRQRGEIEIATDVAVDADERFACRAAAARAACRRRFPAAPDLRSCSGCAIPSARRRRARPGNCSARCEVLITTSRTPAARESSPDDIRSARLPPARSSGFGVVSLSGRMRSPRPAAKISARADHAGQRASPRGLRDVALAERAFEQIARAPQVPDSAARRRAHSRNTRGRSAR